MLKEEVVAFAEHLEVPYFGEGTEPTPTLSIRLWSPLDPFLRGLILGELLLLLRLLVNGELAKRVEEKLRIMELGGAMDRD